MPFGALRQLGMYGTSFKFGHRARMPFGALRRYVTVLLPVDGMSQGAHALRGIETESPCSYPFLGKSQGAHALRGIETWFQFHHSLDD